MPWLWILAGVAAYFYYKDDDLPGVDSGPEKFEEPEPEQSQFDQGG